MIAILSGMSTMNRFVRQQRVQIGTLKAFGFKIEKFISIILNLAL